MKKKDFDICLRMAFLVCFTFIVSVSSFAQKRNASYDAYVRDYSALAIKHMKSHKIPASITLAQGILESGAGKGMLAVKANNHFGIKCHKDWKGGKVYKDDDAKNECFRKYKKAEDSYHDHSLFLVDRPRYAALFRLKTTDYRGWAKGLQQAGYATDKAYANKLIKLIEDNELYKFDSDKYVDKGSAPSVNKPIQYKHTPFKTNGLLYVVAQEGDTYEDIAREFDFSQKELCKYNEVPKNFPLKSGDIIYFQKKRSKALNPNYEHIIRVGESMHSISQLYGVQVKNLYKMNKKDLEYVPEEGHILKLR